MVGIGGIGMSGIAALLQAAGCEVSGSDLAASPTTARLRAAGIRVAEGHAADHLGAPDLVVASAAVPDDNPELAEARRRGLRIVGRGALLAELARTRRAIAVAGSHGKTTTASMIGLVLQEAGFDPTVAVGGVVAALGGNARPGRGAWMVLEADESDRSFLELAPEIAVLTNVDDEHLEAYGGIDALADACAAFAASGPAAGRVVLCAEDDRLVSLAAACPRPVVTYGLDRPAADVRAERVELGPAGSRARVTVAVDPAAGVVDLALPAPGRHTLLNALGALGAAAALGIVPARAAAALGRFTGVERRFTRVTAGGVSVIDDYAHHPTEVRAVIETARLSAPRRLIVVFQPHRYTRTARLLDRFAAVLAEADAVILTEVHAASEPAIDGVDAAALAAAVRRRRAVPVTVAGDLDAAADRAAALARTGDAVLLLGAGSIGRLRPRLVDRLQGAGG